MFAGLANRSWFGRGLQAALIAVLLAVAVLIAMAKVNPFTTDMDYDSGVFAYVASQLVLGKTPYVAAWDQKPPGVYFINALAIGVAGHTRWAIWGIEFLFVLGAAAVGFRVLQRDFGFGPALFGSIAWLWAFQRLLVGGNYTEEYSLVFSFAALWIFILLLERPRSLTLHAALGLAFGCSFLTRPNNAGVQVSILLAELILIALRQQPWDRFRGLSAAAGGFLLPVAGVSLYFAARHAWQPYLQGAFAYNYYYALVGDSSGHFDPLETLRVGIRSIGPAAIVALVGLAAAFGVLAGRVRQGAVRALSLWLCLDFIIELFFSSLTGNNYSHYFMLWLPWVAVACALLFGMTLPLLIAWVNRLQIPILVGAIVMLLGFNWNALRSYDQTFAERNFVLTKLHAQNELVDYVAAHTRPAETVLVWSAGTAVNYLAGRASPTAYFLYSNFVPSPYTERMSLEFNRDLRSHPPALIIDRGYDGGGALSTPKAAAWAREGHYVQPHMQDFLDFVHQNYRPETVVGDMLVYTLAQ